MLLVTTLLSVIRVFLFSVINCVIHVVNHVSFVIICPNWDRVRGWIKVDDGLKLMRLMTVSRAVHSVQGFFSAVRTAAETVVRAHTVGRKRSGCRS